MDREKAVINKRVEARRVVEVLEVLIQVYLSPPPITIKPTQATQHAGQRHANQMRTRMSGGANDVLSFCIQ